MPDQKCPNCQAHHDVSIFVTGQRVRCSKCGIRFEVVRSDTASAIEPPAEAQESASSQNDRTGSEGADAPLNEGALEVDRASQNDDTASLGATTEESSLETAEDKDQSDASGDGPGARHELAEDATAISKGVSIPGYEVLQVLGRGGMGDVYLARQASLNREVAIKVLAGHLADDPDFVRRFEKEAHALATLSHPNVVSIIDRGSHGGILYFVMEYVDGHSLRDVLRKGPMEPAEAVKVVTQVCNAIDYAHGRGVIHRDLKPENILIDVHGHVKVADFGLAGIIGGDERIHFTRTDVAMGTFNYMAPEQRRNAREVDARADLFSLGVVLYELLTGEVPVGRFQLPSQLMPGLDPKIDEIVERALQTNPGERYQRASAIHEDLGGLVGNSRLTVAPAPARQFGQRERARSSAPERDTTSSIDSISSIAKSADSVVDRASRSLFKLARLGLALVALALVGVAFIGSFRLIGWLGNGEREPSFVETEGEDRGSSRERMGRPIGRPPSPPESPLVVPIKELLDGPDGLARRVIDFTDDTAGEISWYHHRGWWENREGVLVHDVFMGGHGVVEDRLIPRAFIGGERYFFEGYRLELTVTLDTTPPVRGRRAGELARRLREVSEGVTPQASVYLYRNMRHFIELAMRLGDDGGYELMWNLDDGEHEGSFVAATEHEPLLERGVRLAIFVEGGRVFVEIDGKPAGNAFLGELTEENWGKAGVGCQLATCTFENVLVEGHARPPPGQEDSQDPPAVPSASR